MNEIDRDNITENIIPFNSEHFLPISVLTNCQTKKIVKHTKFTIFQLQLELLKISCCESEELFNEFYSNYDGL